MSRYSNPTPQFLDNAGDPLPGGKLFYYETGTTTLKDTYADSGLTIVNPNPIILDGSGRTPNVFLDGAYKVRLLSALDVQIWERDPVGGSETLGQWSTWDSTVIYAQDSIVQGSDGEYYISIINSNQNNDPTSAAAAWSMVVVNRMWNTNEIYGIDDIVKASDGDWHKSLVTANSGNDPISSPTKWIKPDSGSVNGLSMTPLQIGDWDMDADATVEVLHSIQLDKITGVAFVIIRDDSTLVFDDDYYITGSLNLNVGVSSVNASSIQLSRLAGGAFDNTAFDSTSFNRGWITITHFL